jgi:hypothetical protein
MKVYVAVLDIPSAIDISVYDSYEKAEKAIKDWVSEAEGFDEFLKEDEPIGIYDKDTSVSLLAELYGEFTDYQGSFFIDAHEVE